MGLGSGIRKKSIPDPGSRGQKSTGSRIRIRNTAKKRIKTYLENNRDTVRFAEGDGLFRGGNGAVCAGNDGQPRRYGRLSRRNLTILKANLKVVYNEKGGGSARWQSLGSGLGP
jgi:hypothetical protein